MFVNLNKGYLPNFNSFSWFLVGAHSKKPPDAQPIARENFFQFFFKMCSKTWLHTKIQPPSYLGRLLGIPDILGIPGVHDVPCVPCVLGQFTDFLGQFPEFPAQLLLYFGLLPPSTLKFSHCGVEGDFTLLNAEAILGHLKQFFPKNTKMKYNMKKLNKTNNILKVKTSLEYIIHFWPPRSFEATEGHFFLSYCSV